MSYLNFVTLNTGAITRLTAAAPDEEDMDAARDIVAALRDGKAAISRHTGYMLQASTVQAALLCTVLAAGDMPLVTFGVAARPRGAAKLWSMLHEHLDGLDATTDPAAPPPAPWCGVIAYPALLRDPELAWAWIARYEAQLAMAWVVKRHISFQ